MSDIKVSVLVPICNVEKYLRECLDSLIHQTMDELQIICIDDGSTDSSPAIIEEYRLRDPRIEVITKPNSGYGDSMNKGLESARGEYIGIVESDDFAELDMFESLYALAKAHDADVVKSNYYRHLTKKHPLEDFLFDNLAGCPLHTPFKPSEQSSVLFAAPSIWTALYRKSHLERNDVSFLPTPGASFQDTSFNFKALASAERVVLTDRAYLHYRCDNAGSSVKSPGKIFFICGEYDEAWKYLHGRASLYFALSGVLPAIQYKAYTWNMDRLSPEVQPQFYRRFAQDFADLTHRNLLNQESFGEGAWESLVDMLEDASGHYRRTWGPLDPPVTHLVAAAGTPVEELRGVLSRLLARIGRDDEVICCAQGDTAVQKLCKELRQTDRRLFTDASLYTLPEIEAIDVRRLRGERVCLFSVDKLVEAYAESPAPAEEASEPVWDAVFRASYDRARLAEDATPPILPLLLSNFSRTALEADPLNICAFGPNPETCSPQAYRKALECACAVQYDVRITCSDVLPDNRTLDLLTGLWDRVERLRVRIGAPDVPEIRRMASAVELTPFILRCQEQSGYEQPAITFVMVASEDANEARTKAEALLGAAPDAEVVCAWAGRTDTPGYEELKLLALENPAFTLVTALANDRVLARNSALSSSRGAFIAFARPDDDASLAAALCALAREASESGAQIAQLGCLPVQSAAAHPRIAASAPPAAPALRWKAAQDFLRDACAGLRMRIAYSKELFDEGALEPPCLIAPDEGIFIARSTEAPTWAKPLLTCEAVMEEPELGARLSARETAEVLDGLADALEFAVERNSFELALALARQLEGRLYPSCRQHIGDRAVRLRLVNAQALLGRSPFASEQKPRPLGVLSLLVAPKPTQPEKAQAPESTLVRTAREISGSGFYRRASMLSKTLRKRT